jgi:Ca-activated chloride channel family protein
MTAQWPGLLWALLLVPVALAAYVFAQRRRAGYAVRFTNLDLLANVVTRSPGWRRHLPPAFYLLALTALLVSMARPQAITLVPKEQATVMLVMDVSGSMNATDVQPTRMVAAQQSATTFVEELPKKLRVGVVSFASTAQTLTRPTTDRLAVYEAIATLHAEGATAMGDGIERALDVKRPPGSGVATQGVQPAPTPAVPPPRTRTSRPRRPTADPPPGPTARAAPAHTADLTLLPRVPAGVAKATRARDRWRRSHCPGRAVAGCYASDNQIRPTNPMVRLAGRTR